MSIGRAQAAQAALSTVRAWLISRFSRSPHIQTTAVLDIMGWFRGLYASVAQAGIVAGALCIFVVPRFVDGSGTKEEALLERLRVEADRALVSGERNELRGLATAVVTGFGHVRGIRLRATRGDVIEAIPPASMRDGAPPRVLQLASGGTLEVLLDEPALLDGGAMATLIGALATMLMTMWILRRRVRGPIEELRHRIPALGRDSTNAPIAGACEEVRLLESDLVVAASRIIDRDQSSRASLVEMESAFERIHTVFRSIDEAVVVVDGSGNRVFANPSAVVMFGLDEHASDEKRFMEWPEPMRVRLVEGQLAAARTASPVRVTALENEGRVFDVSINPLRRDRIDADESMLGVAFVFVDRTKAYEVRRMKEDFLSSVSHELRTPLTSIRSFTELLMQLSPSDGEEVWMEFLQIIQTESDRLTRLVDGLLDLNSVETDRRGLELAAHDLAVILDDVLAVLAASIVVKRMDVELFIDPTLPLASVDGDGIHQVFSNIVANACKFVPNGGTLRISAHEGEERRSIRVEFEDSGPGVPAAEVEAIFEKFSQGSHDLTDKPEGTGLGLAICRELLMRMGGKITCAASPALGGARFAVEVPRAETSQRRAPSTSRFERLSRTLRVPAALAGRST
ncbi:MAG: hypothetical protein H6833_06780 [Planctomycetes bacterium]|nr:hypothetical protein [Planctomycetota bacterium]